MVVADHGWDQMSQEDALIRPESYIYSQTTHDVGFPLYIQANTLDISQYNKEAFAIYQYLHIHKENAQARQHSQKWLYLI